MGISLFLPLARLQASSVRSTYDVRISTGGTRSDARGAAALTPFQNSSWLAAWYRSHAASSGYEPLFVEVFDRERRALAVALPLVARQGRWARRIEFADAEVSDYNAPLLGPAAPRDTDEANALWRAVARALSPSGGDREVGASGDAVVFRKMPVRLAGRLNPLAMVLGVRPSLLNGNVVTIDGSFDDYHFSLEKTVRKELERSWRVFTKAPAARFVVLTNPSEALSVLEDMEGQQRDRMEALGKPYRLDRPETRDFYRALLDEGLHRDDVTLTALKAGDELVAGLLGVRLGQDYVMIRISNRGGEWSNCSPGRLIIHRTMAHLHEQGIGRFDFSIGNYPYKVRFQPEPLALVDLVQALSPRGMPIAAKAWLAHQIRQYPALDGRLRHMLGRPQPT